MEGGEKLEGSKVEIQRANSHLMGDGGQEATVGEKKWGGRNTQREEGVPMPTM